MKKNNLTNRTIFCQDNIDVLKGINSNSIDLIYLDPPFSKNDTFITKNNKNIEKIKKFFIEEQQKYNRFPNEDFNEIFKDNTASFSDIWTENDINQYYYTQIDKFNNKLVDYLDSIKDFAIKGGFYYLLYMTVRLIEIKRILKDTGSIYYHCDPTFSHYIKAVMDRIFGVENFLSDITWKRYAPHSLSKSAVDTISDNLLYYAKDFNKTFYKTATEGLSKSDLQKRFPYSEKQTGRWYQHVALEQNSNKSSAGEPRIINGKTVYSKIGWRWSQFTFDTKLKENPYLIHWTKSGRPRYKIYKDEYEGRPVGNIWTDIRYLSSANKERTGYPTQKPLALLERIIKSSSKEGDIILDPFCGCATTCIASEKLNRQWIGIDWNKQSFYMIYYRAYLMDILGTEHAPSLLSSGIIQETNVPQRTDISQEELNKIQKDLQYKQEIKQTKKVRRMSLEDKAIAKELLYEEQAGICNGCDAYMRSVDLTIDHITPQAQDGDDDLDNLQLLCYRCNNWKRTKDMKYLFNQLFEKNIITKGTYNKQVAKLNQ